MCTQVGLIAKRLGQNKSITEKNPLMSAVNKLASYLAMVLALVIVCAALVAFMTRYQDPQRPCAEDDEGCFLKTSLLRAVVMSVALIPHGLPFICTVMLYVGSAGIGKRNGVVMKVSAVDYLAATTVICTDKTGTLTEGRMVCHSGLRFLSRWSNSCNRKLYTGIFIVLLPVEGFIPKWRNLFHIWTHQEAQRANGEWVWTKYVEAKLFTVWSSWLGNDWWKKGGSQGRQSWWSTCRYPYGSGIPGMSWCWLGEEWQLGGKRKSNRSCCEGGSCKKLAFGKMLMTADWLGWIYLPVAPWEHFILAKIP